MSQSTDSPIKNEHPNLDEESTEKLRQFREVMLQRFNEHTAGKMPLPPEQSLSLRSNISKITEMIEPGTQAMWPEYSSAEKAYLAEQSANHKRDANNLGIALLGPMASPAILAKELGAPTETVSDLLQIGFNIAGAKSLSGAGRTSNARGVIEPKVELETVRGEGQVHQEPHANQVESTPYSPQTATDNIMKMSCILSRMHLRLSPFWNGIRLEKRVQLGNMTPADLRYSLNNMVAKTLKSLPN